MPASSADVLDSADDDFEVLDDGYDYRPVSDTYPAPVLAPDDRSSAYTPDPMAARRSGLFDAYALLRQEPSNPSARGPVRVARVGAVPPVVARVDAHGFASLEDAGFIHDCGQIM